MTTLNSALREIIELAERLGYDVMGIDSHGEVRLMVHGKFDLGEITVHGLYAKSLMERCLRDQTETTDAD